MGEAESFNEKVEKYLKWKGYHTGYSRDEFYYKELFPEVLKRFLDSEQSKKIKTKGYKYVISLVGFSPQPIIFWHKLIEPYKHFFICSPETEKTIDAVFEKIGYLPPSKYDKLVVKSTNSLEIYKTIKDSLNKINKAEWNNTLIDITGGKKSMAGAASIVGGLLKIGIGYIDYKEYDKESRKPKPGTEFPITLSNPLEVFGDVEIAKAKDYFNSFQFERALEILERLKHQIRDIITVEKYITLNNIYNEWNKFNIEKSIGYASEFLENVERERYVLENSETHLIEEVEKHRNLLNNIKAALDNNGIKNPKRFYIPVNLYFAAERYATVKKFDIAVFLMYRAIESIEQIRLEKYRIDSSNASDSQYIKNNIHLADYNNIAKDLYGKSFRPLQTLPKKIALMDGYILLKVLNDKVAGALPLERILNVTRLRNKSIYAHGLTPLAKDDFREIHRVGASLLVTFLDVEHKGSTLKSCEEEFKFPKI